jgi:hypothetical protein
MSSVVNLFKPWLLEPATTHPLTVPAEASERREYLDDEEESSYGIVLRYNRLAWEAVMKIVIMVAACVALLRTATPAHAAPPMECAVPSAHPDDGVDDRLEIQKALDQQGCAHLGPGVYDIGINPGTGLAGISALAMKDARSLRGTGPRTVLKFAGKAHGDWNGIRMSGANVIVSDLYIDTSVLTGTSEQAHAIQVQGHPAAIIGSTKGATIRDVWFNHPIRRSPAGAPIPGGDCIRLLGEETNNVTVTVTNNHFLDCDRSGIAIQRGTFGAIIADNIFYRTGDQDIDAEMTGSGIGGDWSITGNVFLPGKLRTVSVGLAGTRANRIVFSANVMLSGGLLGYNLRHAVVSNNVFVYSLAHPSPVITMKKASEDIVLSNNVIVRESVAGAGPLLVLEHHNSGNPGRLSVVGNSLIQQTESTIANLINTEDVLVADNRIHYEGKSGQPTVGLSFTGVTRPVNRVLVSTNMFTGPLKTAVRLESGTIRASVVGNIADAVAVGLECGAVGTGGAIVSNGNNWAVNACTAAIPGM